MRWLTITAAMAALAMVGLQSPQAPVALERPETIRSIAPLTYDGRVGCTVFSINGNGTWASAYHCIVGLPDLALLRIEDLPAVPLVAFPGDDLIALKTAFGAPALRLAAEAPEADDSLVSLGFMFGNPDATVLRGFVMAPSYVENSRYLGLQLPATHTNRTFLLTSIPFCKGHSGAPIGNHDYEVVSLFQLLPNGPCSPVTFGPSYEVFVKDLKPLWDGVAIVARP